MDEQTGINVAEYAPYMRTARRRVVAERQALQERYARAWALARRAAALLRKRYAAQRVVLFGSLLYRDRFTAHSDVDLAVWGIPWPEYLHALGEVLDLDAEIEVDLVDMACCHAWLRGVIEREGMVL
jgi:predicted nucleotidyltransferase